MAHRYPPIQPITGKLERGIARIIQAPFLHRKAFAPVISQRIMLRHAIPLEKNKISPVSVLKTADATYYIDFGKAAFGSVELTLTCEKENQQVEVHLGEVTIDNRAVNREPGGSRRYRKMNLNLIQGTHTYTVLITPDDRNTRKHAILMPSYTGEGNALPLLRAGWLHR